jgi:anti-sigma-K factor RskA
MDEDERNTLAGEYALGLLTGEDLAAAEALRQTDAAFAAAVQSWRADFMLLAAAVEPATPPPRVWTRIDAATAPRPAPRRRVWWLSGLAGAAVAAGVLIWFTRPPAPVDIAMLSTTVAGNFDVQATETALIIKPETVAVPAGKAAELWLIAPGQAPKPLGLLDAHAALVTTRPVGTGLALAISLEPPGGSPTGLPTGPVIGEVSLTKL